MKQDQENREELSKLLQKYQSVCLNFDPYKQEEMSLETKQLLLELELTEYLINPFEFTNIVLKKLDTLENKLKKSVH